MEYENEITVEITCNLNELKEQLKKADFKIKEEYDVNDIYMIDKDYISNVNHLEMLKHCVLLRHIIEDDCERKIITYKYKKYNVKEEIIKQGKVNCKVESISNAKKLFEAINYEELIKINDHLIVCANNEDELAIQLVNDKHIYIEIEEKCNYIDKTYLDIEEMKNVMKKYNIPIKENNYFVKKAEVELNER